MSKTTNRPCYECNEGYYEKTFMDQEYTLPDGFIILVPNVPVQRCNQCGDISISYKTVLWIQKYIEQHKHLIEKFYSYISQENIYSSENIQKSYFHFNKTLKHFEIKINKNIEDYNKKNNIYNFDKIIFKSIQHLSNDYIHYNTFENTDILIPLKQQDKSSVIIPIKDYTTSPNDEELLLAA